MKKDVKKKKIFFDKERLIITSLFLIVALVLLGISIFKIIKEKNFNAASLETTILFAISLAYIIYKLVKDNQLKMVSITGKELPKTNKKKDINKRIKNYFLESLIFSAIVTGLDLLAILFFEEKISIYFFKGVSYTFTIFINCLITFVMCLIVSFALEYLIGEIQARKNNRGTKNEK